MGRSILAILAGYLTMLVGVSGALAFAAVVLLGEIPTEPKPFDGPAYFLWVELLISLLAAIAGGYVCALVAKDAERKHIAVLIGLMLVLSVVSIAVEAGLKPRWSSIAVPLAGILGVWLGGRLRLVHRRI